ncbi:MAG: hypothetical protein JW850_04595 [Thermoflexales bacterium]|nr:hypothetical protein [Thermoflexales bacterium]
MSKSSDASSVADGLGFTREAREGSPGHLCLTLMMHVSSEMEAGGITGDIPEFRRRYEQVLSGERECPLAATCPKYRRAIERGAQMIHPQDGGSRNRPVQLAFC